MHIAAGHERIVIGGHGNDFLRARARQLQRTLGDLIEMVPEGVVLKTFRVNNSASFRIDDDRGLYQPHHQLATLCANRASRAEWVPADHDSDAVTIRRKELDGSTPEIERENRGRGGRERIAGRERLWVHAVERAIDNEIAA
jgi:hypothetical protein